MTPLRHSVALGALCAALATTQLGCETESAIVQPCPEGTVRSASGCVGDGGVIDANESDAAASDTTGVTDTEADAGPTADATPAQDAADAEADAVLDDTAEPDTADTADEDAGPEVPTALPFTVDDYYAPSGFMGDGETPGGITLVDNACEGDRAGDGLGFCREFTWTKGTVGWGGVYWQYPDGNWGTAPGLPVPAGATEVTFYAWGATGEEVVNFLVGIGDVDGFAAETGPTALTSEPTEYRISLEGRTIGAEVVGGVGWVANTGDGATFTVDNIEWR